MSKYVWVAMICASVVGIIASLFRKSPNDVMALQGLMLWFFIDRYEHARTRELVEKILQGERRIPL